MTKADQTRLRNLTEKSSKQILEGRDEVDFARLIEKKKLEALGAAKKTTTTRKR